MPNAETLTPDLFSRPEASTQPGSHLSQELGGIALHDAVSVSELYIDEGLMRLETEANKNVIRPGEEGRITDPEEARKAAIQEEVNRTHEAALSENEMFNIHAAALLENEMYDTYTEALREDQERSEVQEQKSFEETATATKAPENKPDFRQEAEQALKSAGYSEEVLAGSTIHRDLASGNLIIINHHAAKMIEPQPGGAASVTTYTFNEDKKILTISGRGGKSYNAAPGDYAAVGDQEGQQAGPEVVTLPLAIARMTGFRKAVRLPHA